MKVPCNKGGASCPGEAFGPVVTVGELCSARKKSEVVVVVEHGEVILISEELMEVVKEMGGAAEVPVAAPKGSTRVNREGEELPLVAGKGGLVVAVVSGDCERLLLMGGKGGGADVPAMACPLLSEGADFDKAVEGVVLVGVSGDVRDVVRAVGRSHGAVILGAAANVSRDESRGLGMAGHFVDHLGNGIVEGARNNGAPMAGGKVERIIIKAVAA